MFAVPRLPCKLSARLVERVPPSTERLLRSLPRSAVMCAALLMLVGVSLQPAFAQSGQAAKVIELNGQVSVNRHGSPWALNVGDSISPLQMIITGPDGSATLQVADGSTI